MAAARSRHKLFPIFADNSNYWYRLNLSSLHEIAMITFGQIPQLPPLPFLFEY